MTTLRTAAVLLACSVAVIAQDATHVTVYKEKGRFGGWPANHGMWSWGNEIVVGFSRGYYKDLGEERHNIDREKPEEHVLARSIDGGETWTIEHPNEKGFLLPQGEALHGVELEGVKIKPATEFTGEIDFTHPDLAFATRMSSSNAGESRFYYSYDRAKTWEGPFKLPMLEQKGVMARTDYIVFDKSECMLFLTASKSNGREGRPFCARTTDAGKTWNFVSYIAPEPVGYSIMPSTVRLDGESLLTAVRVKEAGKSWIDAYASHDRGATWSFLSKPAPSTGEGNPASMVRLQDGRVCITYGYRAAPFGMRARVSSDDGKTWGDEIHLRDDGAGRDIGYPRTSQRPDGALVTVYYYHDKEQPERY
ncbi:MAG: sialidase family protein, partial [Candidatus Hydrogenedentes bacterium]|nr:sialidase family protein [Candidatus Hydrogenedentota bacterium]